jgi:hypothetical protein
MATLYKAELIDSATPWVQLWDQMYQGLLPYAREVLGMLDYYVERGLKVPSPDSALSAEEDAELLPIVSTLTIAAVESQKTQDGVLVATLLKVAKDPSLLSLSELHPHAQWEMAHDYQRGEEVPGTFAMDIWGTEQTQIPYIWGEPTSENIARAAKRAANRIQQGRSLGRPGHPAHALLAERLAPIFRATGQRIVRHRQKTGELRESDGKEVLVYVETGPFNEFLDMVLKPLRDFLRERELAPVTTERIVRLAVERSRTRDR